MATANPDGLRCGALRRDSVLVSTAFRSLTEWRGAMSGFGSAPRRRESSVEEESTGRVVD